jgi:hypothetical protein
MTVFWVVAPCSLIDVYRRFKGALPDNGAAIASETSVNFYHTTQCNNPEDSHLHTRRHENLKSQNFSKPHLYFLHPKGKLYDSWKFSNTRLLNVYLHNFGHFLSY